MLLGPYVRQQSSVLAGSDDITTLQTTETSGMSQELYFLDLKDESCTFLSKRGYFVSVYLNPESYLLVLEGLPVRFYSHEVHAMVCISKWGSVETKTGS